MLEKILPLIINLRKGVYIEDNWVAFKDLVEGDVKTIVRELNTRWLISICDTYVDFGNQIEKRNAMLIVMLVNMEKLAQTNMYMHDCKLNKDRVVTLKKEKPIDLWDGMTTFHLKKGDLTNNMFKRLNLLLIDTPHLLLIFEKIIKTIKKNDTILSSLNKYHKGIFNY